MNSNLKKILAGSLALVMMLGIAVGSNLRPEVANAEDAQNSKKIISVSGQAKVKVAPDIAYVEVGVRTTGKTAVIAQQDNAKKMSAVIDAIKKAGIDAKDIKTSNYYVNPTYSYENNVSKLNGYEVTNTVSVKVRDIAKTGSIIDLASNMGSNITNSVRFGLVDETVSYNQALAAALKNAQGKASTLADAAGVKISTPTKITEQSFGGVQPMYSNAAMNMKSFADSESSTPVESGEIEITASVQVDYEY